MADVEPPTDAAQREALGLSAEEVAAASRFGMTPEAYAAAKQVRNIDDWLARHERAEGGTNGN